MDTKSIKQLVDIFEKSSLSVMETEQGDFRLRLERATAPAIVQTTAPANAAAPAAAPAQAVPVPAEEESVDFNHITEVKSPMVGVFYASPAPGAKAFVERGSRVKKGDVLCIIEAMKLMNEILAENDGEVVDICAENGQVVEFSQVLFKIF